jgi:hypothetical protein
MRLAQLNQLGQTHAVVLAAHINIDINVVPAAYFRYHVGCCLSLSDCTGFPNYMPIHGRKFHVSSGTQLHVRPIKSHGQLFRRLQLEGVTASASQQGPSHTTAVRKRPESQRAR